MAKFSTYAEVVGEDHPQRKAHLAGLTPKPGAKLSEILRSSGGTYETTVYLPPALRDDLRRVGTLTSDPELLRLAEQTEVPLSLEHLRGLDGETLISYGARLQYENDEGRLIGDQGEVPDPRRAF